MKPRSSQELGGAPGVQRVAMPTGERTWTVVDAGYRVIEPVEGFLEYLRMLGRSPNTVKSYARALALWCEFLDLYGLAWDAVRLEDFGSFLGWLRTGDTPQVASIEPRPARFCEETVAVRLQAVASFYRRVSDELCVSRGDSWLMVSRGSGLRSGS